MIQQRQLSYTSQPVKWMLYVHHTTFDTSMQMQHLQSDSFLQLLFSLSQLAKNVS